MALVLIVASIFSVYLVNALKVQGHVVNSTLGAISPVPLPVHGSCTAGTQYTISRIDDLYADIGNLECIFAAGVVPQEATVPLGYSYGYLLTVLNTAFWDVFAELAYQGDYVVTTQCSRQFYNIGWLSVAGMDVGTAVWSVGQFPYTNDLAAGEYPLGTTPGIIMDFTVDFNKLCGVEGNESILGLKGFSPFSNSIWPINQFVDYARIVGRDLADGGLISLNKAYIIPKDISTGVSTVLFYATKNFDPLVLPDFAKNTPQPITVPLGPNGEQTINYVRGGVESLLPRLSPAGIFRDPAAAVRDFFNVLYSTSFNSFPSETIKMGTDFQKLAGLFTLDEFSFNPVPNV